MGIKLSTAKKALIKYVQDHKDDLRKSFPTTRKEEALDPALDLKNWKRRDSYINPFCSYEKIHEFVCVPFGKQLIGYVYTDPKVTKIDNAIVQTE